MASASSSGTSVMETMIVEPIAMKEFAQEVIQFVIFMYMIYGEHGGDKHADLST